MEQDCPIFNVVEGLQEASAKVGLTEADVLGLLFAGLEVSDVVNYVEAVMRSRVH